MATTARKTDLSPLEAIVVEGTLGDEARNNERSNTMAYIQQLTKERQKLYARSAAHPLYARTNGPRIRAIGVEIEQLWDLLRRERASRRVQIERALNVVVEDDDREHDHHEHDHHEHDHHKHDHHEHVEGMDTNSTDAA